MLQEVQETTNTIAEVMAMVEALRYCSQHNITQICLQTDSMMLNNVIEGIWKLPWMIAEYVKEIRRIMDSCNDRISHIFREGNKLADHLANYALDYGSIECASFLELEGK